MAEIRINLNVLLLPLVGISLLFVLWAGLFVSGSIGGGCGDAPPEQCPASLDDVDYQRRQHDEDMRVFFWALAGTWTMSATAIGMLYKRASAPV